jgi:predicted component of type VI protein secretion system
MSSLRLVPVSGPPIDVETDQAMVGRDPGCEIVVTDGSVSRRHARLERRGAEWWVVDQGSANGTYLNSARIAEQALKTGQELRFGALAFRVDLREDPEATVATPLLEDLSAATMAASPAPELTPPPPLAPPPLSPAPPVKPARAVPPPIPPAAAAPPPPPAPPSAAAAQGRFRRTDAPPPPPVGQIPAGPPPKKGRSPVVWILAGCCGCLLLVALLIGVIGGGAFMATRPVANTAHQWLAEVRQSQMPAVAAALSSEYQGRLTEEQLQEIASAIQQSTDASFFSRSIDNDRAVLRGVLTGGPTPQPITIQLVKEGGAWKIDDVRLGVE